jgi:hypothetical protein
VVFEALKQANLISARDDVEKSKTTTRVEPDSGGGETKGDNVAGTQYPVYSCAAAVDRKLVGGKCRGAP